MLHVSLPPFGVDLARPQVFRVGMVGSLTECAVLLESSYATMEDVVAVGIIPSVLQIKLPDIGFVHECVAVVVMTSPILVIVSKNLSSEFWSDMHIGIGIGLYTRVIVAIEIDGETFGILRLQILHIDLSRYTVKTVLHSGSALRHRYRLHPWTRHITQREGFCRPEEIRLVFTEHLHIGARQSEEFYLLCAGSGIGIVDVYRRIVLEGLSEIAACGTEEFFLAHLKSHLCAGETLDVNLPACHLHLVKLLVAP